MVTDAHICQILLLEEDNAFENGKKKNKNPFTEYKA